jgi:hypothetical protein
MNPILHMLLPALLMSAVIPAFAVYKCESDAKVTYSDTACVSGQSNDLGNPATGSDNAVQARRELAQQKAEVKRLENARHKQEAQQEKLRKTAAHTETARQKKCASLARRKKWADEDAAAATGKSREKARRKARHAEEIYGSECGV